MIDNKKVEREVMLMLNLQHVRLKCLKLAVQAADPEAELDVRGMLSRAQLLVDYVISGEVPAAVTVPMEATNDETVAPGDGI